MQKIYAILDLFGRATRMQINGKKSTLSPNLMEEEEINTYKELFPFEFIPFDAGLKYLGFHLRPPMQKKMTSAFTIGLMESNKQELEKLPPWGCKPFYFRRQVSLARV
jgi:hypothetical protein